MLSFWVLKIIKLSLDLKILSSPARLILYEFRILKLPDASIAEALPAGDASHRGHPTTQSLEPAAKQIPQLLDPISSPV